MQCKFYALFKRHGLMRLGGNMLYLSYDNAGFKDALDTADNSADDVDLCVLLEYLISYANHDWFNGHCESFQIYNEAGEVVFDTANVKRGVA